MGRSTPLTSPRRAARFQPVARYTFRLPARCPPVANAKPKQGFHTYYLSCDPRGLALYLPHAVNHHRSAFRAVIVAPAGLVIEPPSSVLLGLQDGDTFEHGRAWVESNPIDEIALEFSQAVQKVTLKDREKAQERFGRAVATLEAIAEQQAEGEAELQAATQALLEVQGVESVFIEGNYYDVSYSRESVYLRRRHVSFIPAEALEGKPAPKKSARHRKKSRRAA